MNIGEYWYLLDQAAKKAYELDFLAKDAQLYFVKSQKKWTSYLNHFLSNQKNV